VLWRASAEALIAAGRARDALTRLEALERLAPELETTRLLALTSYELDRDEKRLAQRIANLTRLDPAAANDVLLQFYSALIEPPAKRQEGLTRALGLWEARATNGLEDLAHARVLALALLEAGRREPALATLREAWGLAPNALARDGVAALLFLAHQATLPPPRSEGRRAKEGGKDGAQDDAPGNVIKSEPQKPTTPATPKPGAKKGAKKKGGKKNAPAKNS
jgi:tetratricopeptide (TPR) repeat protein